MNKIENIINKMKNLNKEEKEKILIKVFVGIIIIYFLINIVFNKKNNVEAENINNKETITEKEDETTDSKDLEKIYVHITGYVNNPGVLELKDGTRLSEAIEKAGGVKKDADIKYLNLAKKVQDGEKIYIPNKKDVIEYEKGINQEKIGDSQKYIEEPELNNEKIKDEKADEKVNINKATKEELMEIPGVGEVTANKIIEKRKTKKFLDINEIKEIDGIGNTKFEKIKNKIKI